jgi:hypothetical protein
LPGDSRQIRQLFLRQRQRLAFFAETVLDFNLSATGFHAPSDRIIDIMSGIMYETFLSSWKERSYAVPKEWGEYLSNHRYGSVVYICGSALDD